MLEKFTLGPLTPRIRVYPHDKLADIPSAHRWRGQWDLDDGNVAEIQLFAYPVIKETPCGVWIHEFPYGEWTHEHGVRFHVPRHMEEA